MSALAFIGFLSTHLSSLPIHSSKGSWERRERFLPRAVGRMPCVDETGFFRQGGAR